MTINHTASFIHSLAAELMAWRDPLGPVEAASWERLNDWLRSVPADRDLTDQTIDTTHVTSSAMVMAEHKIVLHKHKRLQYWIQPGGHVDPGETLVSGAIRETSEETGLQATAVELPTTPLRAPRLLNIDAHEGGRGHFHFDFRWLCYSPEIAFTPAEGESQDIRWVTAEEGLKLSQSRSIKELLHLTSQRSTETMLQIATKLGVPITHE